VFTNTLKLLITLSGVSFCSISQYNVISIPDEAANFFLIFSFIFLFIHYCCVHHILNSKYGGNRDPFATNALIVFKLLSCVLVHIGNIGWRFTEMYVNYDCTHLKPRQKKTNFHDFISYT